MVPDEFSKTVRGGREYLTTGPAWRSFIPSFLFLGTIGFFFFKKEQVLHPLANGLNISPSYLVYGLLGTLAFIVIRMALIRNHFLYEFIDGDTIRTTTGYFITQEKSFPLKNVSALEIKYGAIGSFLDYGDLNFYGSASGVKAAWKWVSRPQKLREFIETSKSTERISLAKASPTSVNNEEQALETLNSISAIKPKLVEYATDTELERTKKFFKHFSKGDH